MTTHLKPRGNDMSAIAHDTQQQHDWDTPEHDAQVTPGRPRRRFLNRKSAALAAAITCIAGFLAGVEIEKSQLSNTATATAATSSGAAGASGGAGAGARAGFLGGQAWRQRLDRDDRECQRQDHLPDRQLGQHRQGHALLRDQDHEEHAGLQDIRPARRHRRDPGLKNSNGTITATSVSDNGAGASRSGRAAAAAAPLQPPAALPADQQPTRKGQHDYTQDHCATSAPSDADDRGARRHSPADRRVRQQLHHHTAKSSSTTASAAASAGTSAKRTSFVKCLQQHGVTPPAGAASGGGSRTHSGPPPAGGGGGLSANPTLQAAFKACGAAGQHAKAG